MFSRTSLSVPLLLALLFSLCTAQVGVRNNTFRVGVILDSDSMVGRMGMTSLSLALSDYYTVNRNLSTRLELYVRDSHGQVIDAAASALSLLKDVEVDAIIGPQKSAQASFVIGLGDRAKVPILSFSATSPSLPPDPYFLMAALVDSAQVGAVAAIVEYYQWSQVVIINEGSEYGHGIIPSLSNAFQAVNARISHRSVIPVAASDDFMLKELYEMKTMQTRVFVVHISSSLASRFFVKVKEAGMMTRGYVWIVTTSVMDLFYSLDSHTIESMEGVLGVRPVIRKTKRLRSVGKRWRTKFLHDNPNYSQAELSLYGLWAYDATWALATAAERVRFREPSSVQNSSVFNLTEPFNVGVSQTGPKLREALLLSTFEGLGGRFHLVDGQLEPSSFQILNVVGGREREVGIWDSSHGILIDSNANVSLSSNKKLKSVVFPGYSEDVPRGWEIPVSGKKLRIGVPVEAGFSKFVTVVKDPTTNATRFTGSFIDMFDAVMKELPYAVPFEYIPFRDPSGSTLDNYDEFCRQVSLQINYDVGIGDISITYSRSKYVDFTLPVTQGGVDMIVSYKEPNDKWFFTKPFTGQLWSCAMALFLLTGVALWILEHRFNGAYRGPPAQHAAMILYFPFMSLVYAQREKIVNNYAKLVVVVWIFVVFILASTYTANLSAMLTAQRLELDLPDANEFRRTGKYVGCRKGSFIYQFLQDLGFEKTKIKLYSYPDEIDKALRRGSDKGGIAAFFSARPYTNLFLSDRCVKYRIRQTYPGEGYAFVFEKGSPLVADVSRAVIELTESGTLSGIQKGLADGCDDVHNSDARPFKLRSFQALFAITAAITITCVIVFLALYLYKNRDFITRISNANTTVWSKARAICKHFDQRDPKSFRSKPREEGEEHTSPSRTAGNPCSSIVVPVSSIEMNENRSPIPEPEQV